MGEPFRRTADDSSSRAPFIKGLLVGVVAMALVWGIAFAMRSPASESEKAGASQVGVGTDVAAKTQPSTSGAAEQCRQVVRAQAPARRAAAVTLAQWAVHVGAMNKLVAGKITLSQATAFWNRTRVGAKRRLARYDAAVRTLATTDASCPSESTGSAGADATCRKAFVADRHELRAADTAIATWRHHVVDMDMLRMGHLSPAQATQMWLRNWHKGVAQLDEYHAARRHALSQHC